MEQITRLKYKGEDLEGIVVVEDESYMTLKLPSGYNVVVSKKYISNIKREEINKECQENMSLQISREERTESNKMKIALLHTGGTIASKVDYRTGAVSSKYKAEELLSLYPEFEYMARISAKTVTNIFSEDMNFEEYNKILEEIDLSIKSGADAIIIAHGTDTIHYTSCALFYGCLNLPIPILLVGAQRSSDRASSDAFSNLKAAISFLKSQHGSERKFRRVGICMHKNLSDEDFLILDGINVKKLHSTRRDAFKQINYSSYAEVTDSGDVKVLRGDLETLKPSKTFSYITYNTKLKGGFFKAHPNMFEEELESLRVYDFLILEGTGVGNISAHKNNLEKDNLFLKELKKLVRNTKVIASTQTTFGEVSLDIYSRGRDLQSSGIIGNRHNLSSETLFMRTAFCLSQSEKSFEEIWEENLEGFEIKSCDVGFLF